MPIVIQQLDVELETEPAVAPVAPAAEGDEAPSFLVQLALHLLHADRMRRERID
jgi:hypothetical protein